MAGRNRIPHHPADIHDFRGGSHPIPNNRPGRVPVHPAFLEEEIDFQNAEIRRIVAENHQLVDENVMMKRDVVAAKDEIHRIGQHLVMLRADKESQSRDLIERCMRMEADLRATEPLRQDAIHLRAEAQNLNASKQDLTAQIQGLTQDITRLRSDNKQLTTLRADVEKIRKEIAVTRRTLEHEKKVNEELVLQKQSMEKNLMSMTHEMQKLRAERLGVDSRAHGFGGSSYGMYSGSPDLSYSGAPFGDSYAGRWGHFDNHGPPRH